LACNRHTKHVRNTRNKKKNSQNAGELVAVTCFE
jgi:hypothetical protein